jgi:hypothetical protein
VGSGIATWDIDTVTQLIYNVRSWPIARGGAVTDQRGVPRKGDTKQWPP